MAARFLYQTGALAMGEMLTKVYILPARGGDPATKAQDKNNFGFSRNLKFLGLRGEKMPLGRPRSVFFIEHVSNDL